MRRTDAWGVDHNYQDAFQKWHDVPPETIQAIHRAMEAGDLPPGDDPVLIVETGRSRPAPAPGTILLEGGGSLPVNKRIPADLPPGYHQFQRDDRAEPVRLIASPGKCWLPEDLKTWGWAVQLYAARSRQSWGIGDFASLEQLARWSAGELQARMLLLNPLSAAIPVKPQQASPYYPSSRRFFNPLWIDVESVPGASDDPASLAEATRAGRELNRTRLIDRDRIFDLKMRALESLWKRFAGDDSFSAFCREQGTDLDRYATFCALAERHGTGWHSWPDEFQDPQGSAVARFAHENGRRVDFHKWLQWLIDRQLARCSKHLAIMQDLPIGVDPDGADVWAWQEVYAKRTGVGAPPDEFNTQGQNWGLPPFIPHRLRAAGYEPFIQTIRAVLRNGGGLRIDHVMGLFRLFWIPEGVHPKDGAYVRYNADELLAIVALESQRARAYVVGEDLGTVENEVRRKLARRNVLSYRLLWFEKKDPKTYPKQALAAVTTHDLPTVAGLWTGSDLARQHELKLKPNEESTAEIHQRLARATRLESGCALENVIEGAYSLLARAPSRILTAALEDAACVEERPNIPATTCEQNPNWSQALPMPIEELMQRDLPRKIARVLHERSG
ncbi:MAG TPA: 4-alpha-glucanotransferase [Bryobacteraceae bacterium]|jgi:4-alpha-glucanotransferase|nr:4-alpha-glucanotransferase [Bryobacteraceae bacterium]